MVSATIEFTFKTFLLPRSWDSPQWSNNRRLGCVLHRVDYILGDPGATSRDDVIFRRESLL